MAITTETNATTAMGNAVLTGIGPEVEAAPGSPGRVDPPGSASDCNPPTMAGQKVTSPPMTPTPNRYPRSSHTDTVFCFVTRAITAAMNPRMKIDAMRIRHASWNCSPASLEGTGVAPPPGVGNGGGSAAWPRSRVAIANARDPMRRTEATRRRGGTEEEDRADGD